MKVCEALNLYNLHSKPELLAKHDKFKAKINGITLVKLNKFMDDFADLYTCKSEETECTYRLISNEYTVKITNYEFNRAEVYTISVEEVKRFFATDPSKLVVNNADDFVDFLSYMQKHGSSDRYTFDEYGEVTEALNLYKLHSNPDQLAKHNEFQSFAQSITPKQIQQFLKKVKSHAGLAEDEMVIKFKLQQNDVLVAIRFGTDSDWEETTYQFPINDIKTYVVAHPDADAYDFTNYVTDAGKVVNRQEYTDE